MRKDKWKLLLFWLQGIEIRDARSVSGDDETGFSECPQPKSLLRKLALPEHAQLMTCPQEAHALSILVIAAT